MTQGTLASRMKALIREVPDYPKAGILFKDITPLLRDPAAYAEATRAMAATLSALRLTHLVAIESRGFLFAGAMARDLGIGLVPVRKPGKLPHVRLRQDYTLEYGTDALEMHADALGAGDRVAIVDDVLATGGTAAAACALVEQTGAAVLAVSVLIELTFLKGRDALRAPVQHVVSY